jgi:hypothetical protein
MPKNEPGEVNINEWYTHRPYSISLACDTCDIDSLAKAMFEWSKGRKEGGSCFLAGRIFPTKVATPFGVVDAIQIEGEINPEHATHCSDKSGQRLVFRLVREMLTNSPTSRGRAWIRYRDQSMAVTIEWLEKYFEDNPTI